MKRIFIGVLMAVALVVLSPQAQAVTTQTGRSAVQMVPYVNPPFTIATATGKVNVIQPNGDVDVILGMGMTLLPSKQYDVYLDNNGGSAGPFSLLGSFTTDLYGSGDFNYTVAGGGLSPGAYHWAIYVNDHVANATVLSTSTDITFTIPA
jgi:hypothetical protein